MIAVFERYFLQEKLDGILGLEALRDQLTDARSEAVGVVGGAEAREMVGAFVIAEFGRCQAVEGGLGFGIVEQRGERGIPFALGASPSMERMVGRPDEFSGGFLLQGTTICIAIHELRDSRPHTARPMRDSFRNSTANLQEWGSLEVSRTVRRWGRKGKEPRARAPAPHIPEPTSCHTYLAKK